MLPKFPLFINYPKNAKRNDLVVSTVLGKIVKSNILKFRAVANAGWLGLIMLVLCATIAGYTGSKLGNCWEFILKKHPELKESGDPYPTIALKAKSSVIRILSLKFS